MGDREQKLPTGILSRLSGMAQVAARTGFSALKGDDGTAAAEKAAQVLGNLRGLASKVGQMASYVDGIVPDAQSEAYARVLSKLQSATPASPFDAVRATIENELGVPFTQAFARFEAEPIASASIGQVHRARLASGEEVAVKVQHAGMAQAMEAVGWAAATSAGTAPLSRSDSASSSPVSRTGCGPRRSPKDVMYPFKHRARSGERIDRTP